MIDVHSEPMTATTIERAGSTLTITTTVDLPRSPTMPIRIPEGLPYNTAATVMHLYERGAD